jgi:hypothetical protein
MPPEPLPSGAADGTAAAPPEAGGAAAAGTGGSPDASGAAPGGDASLSVSRDAASSTSGPGDTAAPAVTRAPASAGVDAAAMGPVGPAGVAAPVAARDSPPGQSAVPASEAGGPGRVLYADNFASAASGWPVQSSDAATRRVGYANGEYFVARLPGSGGSPYVMREERFGDFLLEVDARLVEPTADAYVFIDFWRQASGEHYSFVVAPDEGAFILRRNTDRDGTTVLDWTRSAAIQPGTATNRLGVRAQGGELTLLVNGEEVGRAPADEQHAGGIGFGVGSLGDGPAEARFGNLVITSVD